MQSVGSLFGNLIGGLFGAKQSNGPTAEQQQAQDAQLRASHAAEEDAQLQASQGQSAATRIARAAGQRILAFQGNDTGVSGGNPKGLATTLGGVS